jgi:1,4-alpha-glucan branching enzyme
VFHINDSGKLIAYHRWSEGGPLDDVVVALHLANRGYNGYITGLPRAGQWRVRFNSDGPRPAGADQRRTGVLECGPGS